MVKCGLREEYRGGGILFCKMGEGIESGGTKGQNGEKGLA